MLPSDLSRDCKWCNYFLPLLNWHAGVWFQKPRLGKRKREHSPPDPAHCAALELECAELLATRFNAKPQQPIATLHASAPARDVTVVHIPKTQVGSADAGDSTVRARSALVEQVIEAVAVPATKQHSDNAKADVDAQRQSLVKRELPAYTAAVDAANGGWRHGPFTVAELLELKKFTGLVTTANTIRF